MDEKKVIATIKKAMPAVVSITISKHLEDLEREMPHELYSFLPGHHKAGKKKLSIPDFLVDNNGMVNVGGGSGFVVDKAGLILTNKHVISEHNASYTVITNDGQKLPATVVSRDPLNDIAILKVSARRLPTLRLASSPKLELGQTVIAIGNALGLFKNTVSMGIISGLSRSITTRENPKEPFQELRGLIQTDAAINPGNSGGPLIDLEGVAVGVNAAIVFDAQNIGFAIPVAAASRDLEDIKTYGRIRRPYLGIRYLLIDEVLKKKMRLSVTYGAIIVDETSHDPGVLPGGPGAKAGLKTHDILLECDGIKITLDHPIQDILEEMEVGNVLAFKALRNGKEFQTKLTLGER